MTMHKIKSIFRERHIGKGLLIIIYKMRSICLKLITERRTLTRESDWYSACASNINVKTVNIKKTKNMAQESY